MLPLAPQLLYYILKHLDTGLVPFGFSTGDWFHSQVRPAPCIVDANILIDLYVGGLLPEPFRLPFKLAAPDVIVGELDEPDGKTLVEPGVEARNFWATRC